MRYYVFIFGILCSMSMVYGQAANTSKSIIKGTVKAEATNQALVYATLVLKDANENLIQGVISDDNGNFELVDIPFGDYTLEISYTGFSNHIEALKSRST